MIAWSSRFDGLNQNWALQEVQHLTCWRHDHQQYVGLELFLATWQPLPSALFSFSSTFSLSSPTFGSSSPAPSLYHTGISHLHWLQIVFPSNFLFNFIGRAYLPSGGSLEVSLLDTGYAQNHIDNDFISFCYGHSQGELHNFNFLRGKFSEVLRVNFSKLDEVVPTPAVASQDHLHTSS